MLNPTLPFIEQLHRQFFDAKPFRHISIDNFLQPDLARQLLEQFPAFDRSRAKNEMGQIGGKATNENIRALGPAYQQLDDFFSSQETLAFLSKLTGIQSLIYDPEYYGGGTHENLHGQELDVHVDFNYHPATKFHRRLNLIIYLNHDWNPEWGGNIEMHSDPRNPDKDSVTSFAPLFNRCMILETNEHSWHGFSEISLPQDKRHLSLKSVALYFYTKNRPQHEIVPVHNTFYIQRPVPKSIKAGTELSEHDLNQIRRLITKRDTWIAFYQNLEIKLNGEIGNLKHLISEIENTIGPTTQGYITQIGKVTGYYPDSWIMPSFEVCLKAHRAVVGATLDLYIAPGLAHQSSIKISINQQLVAEPVVQPGEKKSVALSFVIAEGENFTLSIQSVHYFCPKELGMNTDERKLVCLIECITALH